MTHADEKEFTEIIREAIKPARECPESYPEILPWYSARQKIMDFVRAHDFDPEQLRAIWKRLYRHLKGLDEQLDLFGEAS